MLTREFDMSTGELDINIWLLAWDKMAPVLPEPPQL
jgi:hypothetical protein